MNLRHTPSPTHIYMPYVEKCKGIIEIGSAGGEGIDMFASVPHQIYIEARPGAFSRLASAVAGKSNARCFNCAISDFVGNSQFHLSSNSELSSSLFPFIPVEPNDYAYTGSITVPVQTLDNLFAQSMIETKDYDFLLLDVQGAEYNVIKGAPSTMPFINYVWTEVDFGPTPMYEGIVLFDEFDAYMVSLGFTRKYLRKDDPWYYMDLPSRSGEALYVRE